MANQRPFDPPARPRGNAITQLMKAAAEGDLGRTIALATKRRSHSVNSREQTPLMLASIGGWDRCVIALIPFSDTRQVDELGRSALSLAAKYGRAGCVRALLPLSDPHTEDMDGRNALMSAAANGHAECAGLLMPETMLGARDGDQQTAFELAAGSGNVECLRLFLAALPPLDSAAAPRIAGCVVSSGSVASLLAIEAPLKASFSASSEPAALAAAVWSDLVKSAARVGQIDMLEVLLPRYALVLRELSISEPRVEGGCACFGVVEAAAQSDSPACVKFLLNQLGCEAFVRGALARGPLTEKFRERIGERGAALLRRALAELERDSISSVLTSERRSRRRPRL